MERGSPDMIDDSDISMIPKMCPKCGHLLIEKHGKRTRWICINPECNYYEERYQDNLMG